MPSRFPAHARSATVLTRQRRGAALLTTVLAVAVAASIVVVLTNMALSDLRTASAAQGLASARADASAAADEFVAELNSDPTGYLRRVSIHERARVCVADPTAPVVQPGEQWPHRCGTAWTYVDPVAVADARIEVHPPGPRGAEMRIEAFASAGASSAAQELVLHRSSASTWTVLSDEDLALSTVNATSTPFESVGGSYYSAKALNPATPNVTYIRSLFAAEGGVPAAAGAETNVRAVPGDPGRDEIRDEVPNPRNTDQMVASVETARGDACRGVAPTNVTVDDADFSLELCLARGQILADTSGTPRAVPDDTAAYLITTELDGSTPVVRVWTSSKSPNVGPTSGNLLSGISGVVAAGNHPGGTAFWDELGVFHPPASGLVFTDADTQLGLCTTFHTGGACPARPGSSGPGMTVHTPMTVVAGTPSQPASLWFGSSVLPGPAGERLGAVAYSKVLFPYWARPTNAALEVHAAIVAFGRGVAPSDSSVHAHPANLSSNAPSNRGGALSVHGSIAAPRVGFLVGSTDPLYASTRVVPTPTRAAEPPAMPSFERRWTVTTDRPVAPSDVCPAGCENFLGGGTGSSGEGVLPPDRPTGLSASVSVGSVTLSWNPVADAAEYAIEYRPTAGGPTRVVRVASSECAESVCSRAVTGLSNGVRYDFTVTAISAAGARSEPSTSVTATPNGVPSAPTGLAASAEGIYRVRLEWVRPSGTIPDGYKVLRDGAVVATVDTETWLDSSLGAGAEPTYTVVAYNSAGDSDESNEVTVSLMPGAPTGLELDNTGPTEGPPTVTLDWGSSPGTVSGYKIQRATSAVRPATGDVVATVGPGVGSWEDETPPLGRSVHYWVFAYNDDGESITATEQIMVRPSAPTGVDVTASGVDPLVTWEMPPSGQQVDSWDVSVGGSVIENVANTGFSVSEPPEVTLTGLGATGTVVVTAKNSGGATAAAGVPYAFIPQVPSSLTFTNATTSSLSFQWGSSALATSYDIERQSPAYTQNLTATSRTITSQPSGQSQSWRVRACNANGCSPWTGWATNTVGGSQTYSPNGSTIQEWTAPPGVKAVRVGVAGARGGNGRTVNAGGSGGTRGSGGVVWSTIQVTPGATYEIVVGNQGGTTTGDSAAGGWPSGGAGSGGGGGNSMIRLDNTGVKIVAAGGGGGGGLAVNGSSQYRGGEGGHGAGNGSGGNGGRPEINFGGWVAFNPSSAATGGSSGSGGSGGTAGVSGFTNVSGGSGAAGTSSGSGAGGAGGVIGTLRYGGGGGSGHRGGGGGSGSGQSFGVGAGGGGGGGYGSPLINGTAGPSGTQAEQWIIDSAGSITLCWHGSLACSLTNTISAPFVP